MTTAPTNPAMAPLLAGDAGGDDTLGGRFYRWWFAPESPLNLGLCRVLFFAAEFFYHLPTRFAPWGEVPKDLFKPVWIFERLHLPVLPTTGLLVLEIAWKLALLLSCVGLFTRAATIVAAVGALYLLGVPFNYGKVYHVAAIMIFTMGIFALSRSGDAVSLDALVRRRRGLPPPAASGEYRWPVRMVWVLMSVLFFNAGMAKAIRGPAHTWIFSENMAVLMTQRHYLNSNSLPMLDWGLFIAKHPILYRTFAAGAIGGEVFLCLALFDRRLRRVLPWMLLSMQVGIGLFMQVWFWPFMVTYLFWVPWDKVARWVMRRAGRPLPESATA